MVGLLVTPTTQNSSTSCCRLPLRMRSRERSSSQMETPAAESSASRLFCAMSGPFSVRAGGDCREALVGGGDDRFLGQAELLVDHGVGRAGPVVVDPDDAAGV